MGSGANMLRPVHGVFLVLPRENAFSSRTWSFVFEACSDRVLAHTVGAQAKERQGKDLAEEAYEAASHARMLMAQGDEDTRQECLLYPAGSPKMDPLRLSPVSLCIYTKI